ncbi:SGNH/GDSL hydrolase family protein [Sphingomonas xinjiangensis]|uniref:Lysophospholipase L1-like esterase n=1 Tax=Sphingomonas xinjiangensis TaxID=643568 RepID=A0A840YRG2_9SPHN|nr:SGNH/GDSL hydrolase family protein [Sphingomonas xinjiangensis]MBB5712271.1 lysophospholipase L1-like esterase [Sphingomonas xinjiangensis]
MERHPSLFTCALLLSLGATPVAAQTLVPGDPYADDPVGIVADPCPRHPPVAGQDRQLSNLHMLTRDFGQLCRYRDANAALKGQPVRVVFIGDSITDGWIDKDPGFFRNGLVDRGIGGQTTPQMLVRFRQDVIDLRPQAVHIMAGTNDVAGNTGPATMETVQGNIRSMAELARANGIKVILASIPPAGEFPWAKDKRPVPQIAAMNLWLRGYAAQNRFTFVDYHRAMALPSGAMKPGLASDGVHPTAQGYAVMAPLALAAIAKTLGRN